MATTKLSTGFLNCGFSSLHTHPLNHRLISPSPRILPASCKMRPRNLSSQPKRQHAKKVLPQQLPTRDISILDSEEETEAEAALMNGALSFRSQSKSENDLISKDVSFDHGSNSDYEEEDDDDNDQVIIDVSNDNEPIEKDLTFQPVADTTKSLVSVNGERLSTTQLEDLIGMIRNAEKNILLLNQARIRAMGDFDKILSEKEALQGEINVLERRLAETDARIKFVAQEKIHVEVLEDQLEMLRAELSDRGDPEGHSLGFHENRNILREGASLLDNNSLDFLNEELSFLKSENISLKDDIQVLKEELSNVKVSDERIAVLEKERSVLESALKELQLSHAVSQEDISGLVGLKMEYQNLWEKVENLQILLDKATKQVDQAVVVLQQNQELRKKVEKLEESLKEVNAFKLSSEKMEQYHELMQQKIKLLEERLERSDEEILACVNLYQESVKEFQDTLDSLKRESKKKSSNSPVSDMPWEFWSRLLLMIDGWLLEKKISDDDAKILRELVWKRNRQIRDAYMACKDKSESEVLSTFLGLTSSPRSAGLHIIHIAAEMAPVAKVGGLGDVVTGLGKALQKKGHLVEIVLPKYDCMEYDRIRNFRALDVEIDSYFDGRLFRNKIWVGTVEGLPVYFIEPHHPGKFFWRGQFYGEHDDFKRFSYFSRAALELLLRSGKKPDIIHCHDWQTAFVAPLYWDLYAPKGLNSARICFTCHNFEYQGTAPASELASCGLDVSQLNRADRMQDHSAHDRINSVKGGVVFSNIVTTVSPTYAQEVRSAEGGRGLNTTINSHSKKFIGILNGIDVDAWNPATDTFLEVQYNANDLEGKAENKKALRRLLKLSFSPEGQPLVGCVTRLVPQKGVHLIRHAIYRTLELGGQFVLLGSSPIPHIQREFEGIANHFQNHDQIRLILKYDESLSHLIYAACDMLIIPSIFEPCGLTQMIAMRYGSIPIVRKTGGLNDSVFDVDDGTVPLQFRNGFSFSNANEQGLNGALERAFKFYKNNRDLWRQLVHKVMSMDFSWDTSAAQYEDLYEKSVARARAVNRV